MDEGIYYKGISYYPASRAIPLSYFPYLVNMIREPNLFRTLSYTADPIHPQNLISFSIRARGAKVDTTLHW